MARETLKTTSLKYCVIHSLTLGLITLPTLVVVTGCNSDKKQVDKQGAENPTSGSGDQTPAPQSSQPTSTTTPATSNQPTAGDIQATCTAQWAAHVKYYSVGKVLTYTTKVQAGTQYFPITHTETVTESGDARVARTIALTASTSLGNSLLTQLRRNPTLTLTKEKFTDLCIKGQGKYMPDVSYMQSAFQITSSTPEQVTITQGTYASQHVKGSFNFTLTTKQILANGDVWISSAVPGLILKQVLVVPTVPVFGTVTISGELASGAQ